MVLIAASSQRCNRDACSNHIDRPCLVFHDGFREGSQLSVFGQSDEVSFGSLLESANGRRLEAKVRLEVLSDFTDEALEGELADEELGGPVKGVVAC